MQTVELTPSTVQEKVDTINRWALELYEKANRQITPSKSWVLVRVLPKIQKQGSIWLPDGKVQNKPIFEAIVLAVPEPYEVNKAVTDEKGNRVIRTTLVSSRLKRGDHVLFEHYAGVPLDTDQKLHSEYRLVREEYNPNEGGVICCIDYDEQFTQPHEILIDLLTSVLAATAGMSKAQTEQLAGLLAAKIEHEFFLADKSRESVTLSGK